MRDDAATDAATDGGRLGCPMDDDAWPVDRIELDDTCREESLEGDEGFELNAGRGGVDGPAWAFRVCWGVLARVNVLEAKRPDVERPGLGAAGRYNDEQPTLHQTIRD